MKRKIPAFFVLSVLAFPAACAFSLADLIALFDFDFSSNEANASNFTDYMADKDGNGVNDTLMIEFDAEGSPGDYIFSVSIAANGAAYSNETNRSIASGIKRINATFPSSVLAGRNFTYSVKIFDSEFNLKLERNNIASGNYRNYEKGIRVLNVTDKFSGGSLLLNITMNITYNSAFAAEAYLKYNDSFIFSSSEKNLTEGANSIAIYFGNETIASTRYSGKYNLTSVSVNGIFTAMAYETDYYDYLDFAQGSMLTGFSEEPLDSDGDGLNDALNIISDIEVKQGGNYNIEIILADSFGNYIGKKAASAASNSGQRSITVAFNGSSIYSRKLNGPYIVSSAKLFSENKAEDAVYDAYATAYYNYTNFEKPPLPDLSVSMSTDGRNNYGSQDFTVHVKMNNSGSRAAFSSFFEVFSNGSFSSNISKGIMKAGEIIEAAYNISSAFDIEFTAIADINDFVEENNEENNFARKALRINKAPRLKRINGISVNETDEISISINSSDSNNDALSIYSNISDFEIKNRTLYWKTTTMDAGHYAAMVNVSDGYLSNASFFMVDIIDRKEIDNDDDGVNDSLDAVAGNEKSVNTTIQNISLSLGGSSNLSRVFQGVHELRFFEGNKTLLRLSLNLSETKINFSKVRIERQQGNSTGYILFSGISLPSGRTKALFMDKMNESENGVCIKDAGITSIAEVSNGCTAADEFRVECDNTTQEGYTCTYNSSIGKYEINGLKHSGIRQMDYQKPSSKSSPLPDSGGSGRCIPDWYCNEWSICINGFEARECSDLKNCNAAIGKPETLRECTGTESSEEGIEGDYSRVNNIKINNGTNNNQNNKNEKNAGKGPITEGARSPIVRITGWAVANYENTDKGIGFSVLAFEVAVGMLLYMAYRKRLKTFK